MQKCYQKKLTKVACIIVKYILIAQCNDYRKMNYASSAFRLVHYKPRLSAVLSATRFNLLGKWRSAYIRFHFLYYRLNGGITHIFLSWCFLLLTPLWWLFMKLYSNCVITSNKTITIQFYCLSEHASFCLFSQQFWSFLHSNSIVFCDVGCWLSDNTGNGTVLPLRTPLY